MKAYLKRMRKNYQIYLFLLIPTIYIIVFAYMPMAGITLAFKKYNPNLGIWGSPWTVSYTHLDVYKRQVPYTGPINWANAGAVLRVGKLIIGVCRPIRQWMAYHLSLIHIWFAGAFYMTSDKLWPVQTVLQQMLSRAMSASSQQTENITAAIAASQSTVDV